MAANLASQGTVMLEAHMIPDLLHSSVPRLFFRAGLSQQTRAADLSLGERFNLSFLHQQWNTAVLRLLLQVYCTTQWLCQWDRQHLQSLPTRYPKPKPF